MIIDLKHEADFDRISKEWGILFFRETKTAIEVYAFKWGIAYRYTVKKSDLKIDVERFRLYLMDIKAIEIKGVK